MCTPFIYIWIIKHYAFEWFYLTEVHLYKLIHPDWHTISYWYSTGQRMSIQYWFKLHFYWNISNCSEFSGKSMLSSRTPIFTGYVCLLILGALSNLGCGIFILFTNLARCHKLYVVIFRYGYFFNFSFAYKFETTLQPT